MFYTFLQNNSGGFFKDPAEVVIIEADSADEANKIAEEHGIYFDGCDAEIDCPCCGDRWYRVDEYDAEEFPSHYGRNVYEMKRVYDEEADGILIKRILVIYKDERQDSFSVINTD